MSGNKYSVEMKLDGNWKLSRQFASEFVAKISGKIRTRKLFLSC